MNITKQEEQDFKRLIKEGAIEALRSSDGQEALAEALRSKKGKEAFSENFVEVYKDFVEPTLEDMWDDIRQLKTEVRHMKEKNDIRFQRLERKTGIAA